MLPTPTSTLPPQLHRVAPNGADGAAALEDRRLIERVVGGDPRAFEDLYDRYSARAFSVAHFVCRDDGRAEDAVQEAFISVWRAREAYRPQTGPVSSWLLTAVRNRAIDVARRDGRHSDRRADAEQLERSPAAGDVAAEAVASADSRHVQAMLAKLPEAQREVIVLAFYGQLTHAEIAHRLGLPEGTVKGRMRLGLNRLRAHIDQVVA